MHFPLIRSNIRIETTSQHQKALREVVLLLANRIQPMQTRRHGRLSFQGQFQQNPLHVHHFAIVTLQRGGVPILAFNHSIVLFHPIDGHRGLQIRGHRFAHLFVQVLDVATRFGATPVVVLDMSVGHVLELRHVVVLRIVKALIEHDVGGVHDVFEKAFATGE